jgi:hypothetical protein
MLSSAAHVRKVQTVKVVEAINNRRAVRSFTAASVDPAVLRSLVHAAVLAPSAINAPPMETHISAVFVGTDTAWKRRWTAKATFAWMSQTPLGPPRLAQDMYPVAWRFRLRSRGADGMDAHTRDRSFGLRLKSEQITRRQVCLITEPLSLTDDAVITGFGSATVSPDFPPAPR